VKMSIELTEIPGRISEKGLSLCVRDHKML
jgi:hypothetical protein